MGLFEIFLVWEEDPEGKTKRGFTFYQPSPHGLKPVLSQRKKPLRFQRLDLALKRIKKDFPGYSIRIFVEGYEGILKSTSNTTPEKFKDELQAKTLAGM